MKLFLALAAVAAVASAAPQQQSHFKWHSSPAWDPSTFKSRNLQARVIENAFQINQVPAQKMHQQTPAAYTPGAKQADCGIENRDSAKIVGGDEAQPNQFPWLVTVRCDSGGWFCTGSLISEDWVLTAGHCVDGCTSYTIQAGVHDRTSSSEPGRVEIGSTSSILHENYNSGSLANDIGLVSLPESVPLSDIIRLSCLPGRSYEGNFLEGEMTTVTGWGKDSDSAAGASPVLRFAKNRPIIANSDCNAIYGIITDSHLCINSQNGIGVCNGDSGGPLNYEVDGRYLQVGVASFVSSAGCESGVPHGFTRVTSFQTWINDNTGIEIPN